MIYSGPATFQTTATKVSSYPDDMAIAFVIGNLSWYQLSINNIYSMYTGVFLGYNLTNAIYMTNEYDHFVHDSALKEITKYVWEFYIVSD